MERERSEAERERNMVPEAGPAYADQYLICFFCDDLQEIGINNLKRLENKPSDLNLLMWRRRRRGVAVDELQAGGRCDAGGRRVSCRRAAAAGRGLKATPP